MVRPARTEVRNADCPHCGARLHHAPASGLTCPRPGCPGPRRHPLALLFARPKREQATPDAK